MTAPLRKAIRDFWQERTRTALVVLAIAMGIAAFDAVLSTYAILTRELDAGYLATNPASATLWTDATDDALLAGILTNRAVSDAEARRVVTGRIKAGPGGWRGLTLFVVKDFGHIRVSTLVPQQGAWPPAAGEILIERDAFQVVRTHIGDTVTVRTAQGQQHTLHVTGSVHDVGQAQARMENIVYGYITVDTLAQLGEEPYLDQIKLLVADDRFDETHIRQVAADVERWVESQGHHVRRIAVPTPGKHPHADIMGLLLVAQSAFGLFVLLLSGILVVNLLTALMASQVRQIGVMKAIGGTRRQIAQIYLGQALLLGIAAIVIALPLGLVGGRALCRYMAVFLNFDITSFAVPAWVYLLVAIVGLVVPLLAAARPVWKGTGISVREALTDYGVSRNTFGADGFDRALAGVKGLGRPTLLAIRSSFRRRTRLALTLVTLATGGLFFMSALNLRSSMINTLDGLFASKKFDLSASFGAMVPYEKLEAAIRKTPGVLRAEGWITTEGSVPGVGDAPAAASANAPAGGHGAATGAPSGDRFAVVALPPATAFMKLQIQEGRDLQPGETDTVVVNAALAARQPQMKVGATVSFRLGPAETSWRVVGIAREPFSPPIAYIPRGYFDAFHPGSVNSLRLVLDKNDPASIDAAKAGLERSLEEEDVRAQNISSKADGRLGFDQHMSMIYMFLVVTSCILGGVGGLGLMTTMSLNVLERRREIGVMRAIGASPRVIGLILVGEGAIIGVMSWALATLAAWPVSKGLGDLLVTVMFRSGLDFYFEPAAVFIWLAVCLSLGAVASIVPAWHASHCPVREVLGYE